MIINGLERETVVYIIDSKTNKIAYLKKNRPKIPQIHNKLLGWGGKFEPEDNNSSTNCAIRELEQELNLKIEKEQLEKRGHIYIFNKKITVFLTEIDINIPEGYIKNEGELIYKPKSYQLRFPNEFPKGDVPMLNKLYFSNEFFEIRND